MSCADMVLHMLLFWRNEIMWNDEIKVDSKRGMNLKKYNKHIYRVPLNVIRQFLYNNALIF